MSLVRTAAAECDHPGCPATVSVDAYTTQPYNTLATMGWSNAVVEQEDDEPEIHTFCPEHTERPAS